MDIMGLVTSGLGSIVTGLFGSAMTAVATYSTQKLKNQHEQAMAKIEGDNLRLEAEKAIKITTVETEGKVEVADADVLKKSYEMAQKDLFSSEYMTGLMKSRWTRWIGALLAFLFGLVDFLKALVRPGLTYYLVGASTWITILLYDMLQKYGMELTKDDVYSLFKQAVLMIFSMTLTIVSWWYADRRMAKYASKFLDK
jgi:hypothetical protein